MTQLHLARKQMAEESQNLILIYLVKETPSETLVVKVMDLED
jgi:hypothetical protein